jgi:carboxypeptidase Taq
LLGSVVSIQIWERAREALPDVDERMEHGDFAGLHEWLRTNLYALGSKLTPADTIERVAGGPIDPEPYLAYLRAKVA